MTTAQHVDVKMRNALAGSVTGIDDHAISALCDVHEVRDLRSGVKKMAKQRQIQLGSVVEGFGIVLAWNQQHVNRRLGIGIFYGNDLLVLVDNL